MDKQELRTLLGRLQGVSVLRFVRERHFVRALEALLRLCCDEEPAGDEAWALAYGEVYHAWVAGVSAGQGSFGVQALHVLLYEDSAVSALCARVDAPALPPSFIGALRHDLDALGDLLSLTPEDFLAQAASADGFARWEKFWSIGTCDMRLEGLSFGAASCEAICAFFRKNGTGLFARYPASTYVGVDAEHPLGLRGIEKPDPLRIEDLVLYEAQRRELVDNTEKLLAGKAAANVLLYGDKGTGKSATCKALLGEYWTRGLRIVEIPLSHLTQLQSVFSILRNQPGKFIVFVDDLAFSDSCPEYTALKTVLEGGMEARPSNVVVYATSNRRNIVRQRFSERQDDVNERDTLEEKFSLADRFDLRITFEAPSQEEYLHIVEALLEARGVDVPSGREDIAKQALAWTRSRGGRSPRIARQFADYYSTNLMSQ